MTYNHSIDPKLNGLHYSMEFAADGKPVQRVKIGDESQIDAFGRFRVSEPLTIFDSTHVLHENTNWSKTETDISGNVSQVHSVNESSMLLTLGTSSGDEILRETKLIFPYQPGKGLLQLSSFVMAEPKANLRQRIGLFSSQNGIFLEQDDLGYNIVLRSYSTGAVVENRVAQANWNVDALDGAGASEINIDFSKAQILWSDIEWLGVGTVRIGFMVDGRYITAHKYHHANIVDRVYMTSANLPLRLEMTNTGVTESNSTMRQICSTVITEGGHAGNGDPEVVRVPSTLVSSAFTPLVSVRLNPADGGNAAIVIPAEYEFMPEDTGTYEVALFLNPDLTGATFANVAFEHISLDFAANAVANGTIVDNKFTAASNQASIGIGDTVEARYDRQLGRSLDGTLETYTLAARKTSGTGNVIASIKLIDRT